MGLIITPNAPIDSPVFTGTPIVPTAAVGTNTTQIASTAFVQAQNSGYTTTATAAGTTTLTVSSTTQQYFTGTTTQIVQLPVTSTLTLGQQFRIVNNSTGAVTINSSGGNAVFVLMAGMSANVTCILTSGTTAASWSVLLMDSIPAVRKVVVSNVKLTNPADTNENTVFTGTIPANSIGLNGYFEIVALWSITPNNANAKTCRIKFNGTTIMSVAIASALSARWVGIIYNRNSLSAQVAPLSTAGGAIGTFGNSGGAVATYTFNTGADITVTVTVQNATGTDTTALEAFAILAVY